MNNLELLLSRKSHNKLEAPAPSDEQLDILFKAALRAPDHALLRPWRYRVYQGDALLELGDLFAQAMLNESPDTSADKLDKIKQKPLRAPMVIVASVVIQEHPKVPEIEQILSSGASVQNILMAAHFQNIGAMWRTGGMAFNSYLHQLLAMEKTEQITGFIYLGQEVGEKRPAKPFEIEEFVTRFK